MELHAATRLLANEIQDQAGEILKALSTALGAKYKTSEKNGNQSVEWNLQDRYTYVVLHVLGFNSKKPKLAIDWGIGGHPVFQFTARNSNEFKTKFAELGGRAFTKNEATRKLYVKDKNNELASKYATAGQTLGFALKGMSRAN